MRYGSLENFLAEGRAALVKGPVAMIFVEDLVEVESTIRYHRDLGFVQLVVFAPSEVALDGEVEDRVHRVDYNVTADGGFDRVVNAVIEAAPEIWLYYCYNAEYLFFPFCETRSIGEMLEFHESERRGAMLAYVVDAYAGDLERFPDAVCPDAAWMDKSGYYALGRPDPATGQPRERQLDFFGGLRWRFEEHVPPDRRKIDRIALFRAKPGLQLRADHTFSDEEYNTYACPWHHNLTAAIVSFRTAKALKSNPGSKYDIRTFRWHNSVPVDWTSQQLLDLGLIEPGQWF
ncbi:MAG TPA: hypothetical protein DIU07_09960 [Rhodobacteraceae bacterium]|nr:hypothetical protein [Paracoccaceae bacterium]